MTVPERTRDDSIDLVRGAAMVLMALDHARDFFGDDRDPTDLATTTFPLFFTRWATHFCAPVFVLLAGLSAFMGARGKTPNETSRALLLRGLWLVLLELTVVRFGWLFDVSYRFTFVQVIWAIGWSMVALAAISRAGPRVALGLGLGMIVLHDTLDGVHASALGPFGWLWHVLHEKGRLEPLPGHRVFVAYPLVPWVFVMATGFGLGPWLARATAERRRWLLLGGATMTAAFVVLRAIDAYGDPSPWTVQPRAGFTLLSFLDCTKYPPSLDYLLMTLGPAAMLWGLASGRDLSRLRPLVTFGRVPLFYYVLHLPLLHGLAKLWHGTGSLAVVYGGWLLGVVLLYPACRWMEGVKARHRGAWWTSYV